MKKKNKSMQTVAYDVHDEQQSIPVAMENLQPDVYFEVVNSYPEPQDFHRWEVRQEDGENQL